MAKCHTCAFGATIETVNKGMDFQETPCATCVLKESSFQTLEYLDNLPNGLLREEGCGEPEPELAQQLPVSVMTSALAMFLTMPGDDLQILQMRYADKRYAEIAAVRGVTPQAVELRLRRIIERMPLLENLFAGKMRKRQARQQRAGRRPGKAAQAV